jgi:predicted Zn-dependent protease
VPVKVKPEDVPLDDKIAFLMRINEMALKVPGVMRVQSSMAFDYEWKYLATSEGSYIEQEIWRTAPGFTVSAIKDGKFKSRTFSVAPKTAGYEVVTEGRMLENVERISAEAIEHCTAPPGRGSRPRHDTVARLLTIQRSSATRPSSIGSSATRPTTRARASSSCRTSAS